MARTREEIIKETKCDIEDVLIKSRISFKYFCENIIAETPLEKKPIKIKNYHKKWVDSFLKNRRSCIIAARGFGKTTILSILFPLWRAFFHEGETFLVISQTLSDSTSILSRIRNYITDNDILNELKPEVGTGSWTKTEIDTSTKCKIFIKPFSRRVRGKQVNWLLLDEAALYNDFETYYSAIVPTTNQKNGHLMAISTPLSRNDLVHELKSNNSYIFKEYPAIKGGKVLDKDFDRKKLNEIKEELGEKLFQREYLLNISAEGSEATIPFNYIVDCFDKKSDFKMEVDEEAKVYFGGDFAISPTGDYTVFVSVIKEEGKYRIIDIQRIRGMGQESQLQRMTNLNKRYNYDRMFLDKSNIGEPMLRNARKLKLPVKGMTFSAKNKKKLYRKLINTVNSGKLIIPRKGEARSTTDRLIKELSAIRQKKSSSGFGSFTVGLRHDDVVDALSLAISAGEKSGEFLRAFETRERKILI